MEQSQKAGDLCVNLQAQGDIHIGVSVSQARDIAQDVFEANMYRLSGEAKALSDGRAADLREAFIDQLYKRKPEAAIAAADPDFQYVLAMAQIQMARKGGKDLQAMLMDLLVDRAVHGERDLKQLVLDECLDVAPKLTPAHWDILSVVFLVRYTARRGITSLDSFADHIERTFALLLPSIPRINSPYRHLEYAGCGAIDALHSPFERVITTIYPGLFSAGLKASDLSLLTDELKELLTIPCMHNHEVSQLNALDERDLREEATRYGLDEHTTNQLVQILRKNVMEPARVEAVLLKMNQTVIGLREAWNSTLIKGFSLTTVGIALAHTNLKRHFSERMVDDLDDWLST